jgi:hypothetical protein
MDRRLIKAIVSRSPDNIRETAEQLTRERREQRGRKSATERALEMVVPFAVSANVSAANDDFNKVRAVASEAFDLKQFFTVREWKAGMTTQPGDLVYAPDKSYTYMYGGKVTFTHNNPTFYPGAAGVFYWLIIPKEHNGFKVYPDVQGIVVAVRKGEVWWNTTRTKMYRWVGEDNLNCVWQPQEGLPALWKEEK